MAEGNRPYDVLQKTNIEAWSDAELAEQSALSRKIQTRFRLDMDAHALAYKHFERESRVASDEASRDDCLKRSQAHSLAHQAAAASLADWEKILARETDEFYRRQAVAASGDPFIGEDHSTGSLSYQAGHVLD